MKAKGNRNGGPEFRGGHARMHLPLGSAQLQLLLLICLGHVDIKQTTKQTQTNKQTDKQTNTQQRRETG